MPSLVLPTIAVLLSAGFITHCEAQAQTWIEDSFEDFTDGQLDASGQNVYVSKAGTVRTIHRFDLNGDGYIDLLFNSTHDDYAFIPSTLAEFSGDRKLRTDTLAVEGGSYGGWTIEGDAFGNAPAAGKLSIQGPVTGFKGRGLVNTFQNRDRSTGTLTSPPFEIQKDYITFLIGGGASHDSCLQLLVDPSSDGAFDAGRAKVVASSSGLNDEALIPAVFDVRGFRGEQAVLRVVDQARGGWGHVNVDHIVMTDEKPDAPMYGFFEKTIALTKDYLILPIQNEGQKGRIRLFVDDRAVRIYDMVLAEDSEKLFSYRR